MNGTVRRWWRYGFLIAAYLPLRLTCHTQQDVIRRDAAWTKHPADVSACIFRLHVDQLQLAAVLLKGSRRYVVSVATPLHALDAHRSGGHVAAQLHRASDVHIDFLLLAVGDHWLLCLYVCFVW